MGSRLGAGRNPGTFFDRADIEREVQIEDGRGGYISDGWEAIPGGSGIPVDVQELDAMEQIRSMQAEALITHEVTTSILVGGVTADMRLRLTSDGDRILYLVAPPIVIGRGRRLRLLCREEVA